VVLKWSRYSAVSVKTKLRDERGRKRSLIPAGSRDFFTSQKRPEQAKCPLSLLYNSYWRGEAFPGIKRPDGKQTTDLLVVLRLGISGAVPLPPFILLWLAHRATLPLIFLLYKVLKFLLLFWPLLVLIVTYTIINSEFSEVRNFMIVVTEVRH
jgi:hypothetical protein